MPPTETSMEKIPFILILITSTLLNTDFSRLKSSTFQTVVECFGNRSVSAGRYRRCVVFLKRKSMDTSSNNLITSHQIEIVALNKPRKNFALSISEKLYLLC